MSRSCGSSISDGWSALPVRSSPTCRATGPTRRTWRSSAFDSFCRGAEQGRFPQLADRDDLWQLLATITARKASDLREYLGRDKRNWRRVQQVGQRSAESALDGSFLSQLLSAEPDPAFAAEVAEECLRLLDALQNEELRQIALRKMEGYTNEEIAAQQGCAPATVERRLKLIRKRWEIELPASAEPDAREDG